MNKYKRVKLTCIYSHGNNSPIVKVNRCQKYK